MSHKRQEIKQHFEEIISGKTVVGTNIMVHRPENIWESNSPFLVLSIPKEFSKRYSAAPIILERKAYVYLETVIQGRNFNNNLDLIGRQIEDIVTANTAKLRLAKEIILRESEQQESPEGEKPAGSLTLVYEVTYYTQEIPSMMTSDFKGIKTRFPAE